MYGVYFSHGIWYNEYNNSKQKGEAKMKDVVTTAVHPLLLGCGWTSIAVSWRFFAEYKAMSTLLDRKRTLLSHLSLFSSFRLLPPSDSDEFIIISLERLADELEDIAPMIVPCNKFYREFVKRNISRLESRFIVRSPERVCNVTPSVQNTAKD